MVPGCTVLGKCFFFFREKGLFESLQMYQTYLQFEGREGSGRDR